MAKANIGLLKPFQITNAATVAGLAVNAQLIMAIDVNNAGSGSGTQTLPNAILAPAKSQYILGVLDEIPDANGVASIQLDGIASVNVGAQNITAGQKVTSDGSGNAAPLGVSASGTALNGYLGIALNSALAGNFVDVLISQSIANG